MFNCFDLYKSVDGENKRRFLSNVTYEDILQYYFSVKKIFPLQKIELKNNGTNFSYVNKLKQKVVIESKPSSIYE